MWLLRQHNIQRKLRFKTIPFYYLSAEEKKIYEKCLRLKHFILETIGENDCINFKELEKKGKLSKYDEKMFEKYL